MSDATFKAPRCHSWVETAEKAVVGAAPVCKKIGETEKSEI